jgi:hypothetical protein
MQAQPCSGAATSRAKKWAVGLLFGDFVMALKTGPSIFFNFYFIFTLFKPFLIELLFLGPEKD